MQHNNTECCKNFYCETYCENCIEWSNYYDEKENIEFKEMCLALLIWQSQYKLSAKLSAKTVYIGFAK